MKNNRFFHLFYYYFLVIIGFIILCWYFWSRFLRERAIREIPDPFFNEIKFWILLIICMLYVYIIYKSIKNLNNKEENAQTIFRLIIVSAASFIIKPIYYFDTFIDRKSTRLNSSHSGESRMPSSA